MNQHGHYWCDHCDEISYGPVCQTCRHDARFVSIVADETPKRRGPRPVPPQIAKDFFRKLHEQINQNEQ